MRWTIGWESGSLESWLLMSIPYSKLPAPIHTDYFTAQAAQQVVNFVLSWIVSEADDWLECNI